MIRRISFDFKPKNSLIWAFGMTIQVNDAQSGDITSNVVSTFFFHVNNLFLVSLSIIALKKNLPSLMCRCCEAIANAQLMSYDCMEWKCQSHQLKTLNVTFIMLVIVPFKQVSLYIRSITFAIEYAILL